MSKGLVCVAGVVVAGGSAFAWPTHGQVPSGDSSVGAGHVLQTDFFGSARAGPNGENPVGGLTLSGYLNFSTSTTCFNASGNALVSGGRILNGRRAGQGFLSSAVDNGPPRNGRPVDVSLYSGYLARPPVNCPSPGDPPPPGFDSVGAGPFTSGDFTLVDARERLPRGTPAARLGRVRLTLRPRRLAGFPEGRLVLRARLCGRPGIALLRLAQTTSPAGRNAPVWVRRRSHDELRHDRSCQVHRVDLPLTLYPGGRRYRVTVHARTTARRWSRTVSRRVDAAR